MSAPPPFKIFVSHIHEEAPLAAAIKDALQDAFPGRVTVFVSSDPRDNPGGDKWLEKIAAEIKDPQTRMVISVISPASIRRLWVLVELGAAWARDLDVFPLCHSGANPGNLPRPLGDFGGAALESDDAADRLVRAVERAVGQSVSKRWSRGDFLAEMRTAAGQSIPVPASEPLPAPATSSRPPEQIAILQLLARMENDHVEDITSHDGAAQIGMAPAIFLHHVKRLVDEGLARDSIYMGDFHYSISPAGAGWLIDNGKMPQ